MAVMEGMFLMHPDGYCNEHEKLRMLCCPVCFQDYVDKAIKDHEAENQRLKAEVESAVKRMQEMLVLSGGRSVPQLLADLQAANLAHEQYREWAAGQMEQAKAELDAARLKMDLWVGDLEGIEADPVTGDPNTTVRLVIKSINRQIKIMTAKKP